MINKHHPKPSGDCHEEWPANPAQNHGPNSMNPALAVGSQELLKGKKELIIEHQGRLYRLQATRQGKLILTK
jgi:hemin uptake protein HemP